MERIRNQVKNLLLTKNKQTKNNNNKIDFC